MRKRSKYKPKGVRLDNMTWVQAGLKKVDEISAGTTLKIRNHDAMNNLRMGTATRRDIDALIDAMNITEALANRGVGEDWKPEIRAAQDAMLDLARRGVANNFRFIARGPELVALNLVMEIHDAQLETVTVKQLETAMADVMESLRLKKMRHILTPKENHATN
jgi:hypothetical protein